VTDIWGGPSSADPKNMIEYNGKLYFVATNATYGTELYETDGLGINTKLVKDIYPGTKSSGIRDFVVCNGKLYFSAEDGTHGYELWVTDGTAAGTQMVKDIYTNAGVSSYPYYLTAFNNKLYFTANSELMGNVELWVSDGTAAGTKMLKDINPNDSSNPYNFKVYNNKLYFVANNGTRGDELWETDGTEAGTKLVNDLNPSFASSSPNHLVVYNSKLYFSANDGSGYKLWAYDANGSTPPDPVNEYAITSPVVNCQGDAFCVTLKAKTEVSNGIIGMDYCLQYDANLMEPTGNVTLGGVVNHSGNSYGAYKLNTNTSGQLHASIYYKGDAPVGTFFQGVGDVICIEFRLKAGTTVTQGDLTSCEIVESYTLKDVNKTADAGNVTVTDNAQKVKGKLIYWNQGGVDQPLAYDANNPSTYLATNIYSTNSTGSATSTEAVQPDVNGVFLFEPAKGSHLSIQRDITANPSDIMNVINGMDCYYAALITTFDNQPNGVNWIPNAFQMLAADVNMNGQVHAGDITLMQQRITLKTAQYPQVWNHDIATGQPLPNAAPSLDWRFVDAHTTFKGADFKPVSNYPVKDAQPADAGYWRDKVPALPEYTPTTAASFCDQGFKNLFYGVLLGDVDGNWTTAAGSQLRTTTETEGTVMIDLFNAEKLADGSFKVPVTYKHNAIVNALDFKWGYDVRQVAIADIAASRTSTDANVQMLWNNYQNKQVLLTSYTLQGMSEAATAYYLTVKAPDGELTQEMFSNFSSFINGKAAEVKVISTAKELNKLKGAAEVSVYPMPSTSGEFAVSYSHIANTTPTFALHDLNGQKQVIATSITEDGKVRVKTQGLKTGIYMLKISDENGQLIATKRVIIQK
jgi:ELWxxDGT repeat protein